MTWRTIVELAEMDDWRELSSVLFGNKWDVNQRNDQNDTSLHVAAERGHLDCLSVLLEHKADLKARDAQGATPLHRAVRRNQAGAVEMLVAAGADIAAEAAGGKTPLDEAKPGSMISVYLAHIAAERAQVLESEKAAAFRAAAEKGFTEGIDAPLVINKPIKLGRKP
jgi:ankyrin repeat protein